MQIIPAIDLIDGHLVRLTEGDYDRKTTYNAEPEDMVRRYLDCGLQRIHVVDLDGAKAAEPQNLRTLERLANIDGARIEWGGGLKTEHALRQAFDAGATYVVVGSVAAKQPKLFTDWLVRFGADRVVLGADVRDGKVAVSGWREDLDLSIDQLLAHFTPHGLSQVICTDIVRDGRLEGPSFTLYTDLQSRYANIDFTVSGGVSSMADVEECARLGLRRVIIGKAIYEQRITLKELSQFKY